MSQSCFIIAVDGTAASGKGTLSASLAKIFGFDHLDTGRMYRFLTFHVMLNKIDATLADQILPLIDEIDFSKILDINLHTPEISQCVSPISAHPSVRRKMDMFQKNFPIGRKGVVIDGRDIGTIIFPQANIKLFITADVKIRAKRRFKQLQTMGKSVIYESVLEDLQKRDKQDIHREVSPTIAAPDAVIIDTTNLDAESVLSLSISLLKKAVDEYKAYGV